MERKFIFNYKVLDNYIDRQHEVSSDRTDGELTLFRDNCKKYLSEMSDNQNEYIIMIDENTGDISINGQKGLEDKFEMMPIGYEMSNKSRLYRQVNFSMESAERLGIFDQIFKEIK